MPSSSLTRPFEAIPPAAAPVLRPVLPRLADETIAAIAREVPDYARAMEGEFGQIVRLGVEVAFNRFVDLIADPSASGGEARETYIDLGRGEYHSGRSLDALLAAYRVGARLAWRRFVEVGVAHDLEPAAIYALGEAIFAYIDELSGLSAAGYAEEQSAAAGETERRRRRRAPPAPPRAPARPAPAGVAGGDPHGRGHRRLGPPARRGGAGGGDGRPPRRARRRGGGRGRGDPGRGDRRHDRGAAGAPARDRRHRRRGRRRRLRD